MPDMNILLIGVSLVGLIAIGAWVRFFFIRFNRICQTVEDIDDSREYIWDKINDVRGNIQKLQGAIDHINGLLNAASSPPVKNVKPRK